MELTAYWEGGYRVRVPIRGFELIADEPPQYGGEDAGPMPTELFLSSLAVCFTMSMYHAFRKRRIELSDLAVRVRGHYQNLRFDRIRVEVFSSHPREELEAQLKRAIGWCYVSNTMVNAPEIEYVISDEPLSSTQAPSPS